MVHRPGQDVRNGFDPPVGMPRKALEIIEGVLVAKIVQQEERVVLPRLAEPKSPAQFHPRPFHGWFCLDNPLNSANGHACSFVNG